MARRWKLAAGVVAWLGIGAALRAQTPPPPLPIAPSGIGGPAYMPMMPIGQPMQPMGPTGPWNPPMPGGPMGGMPMPGGAMGGAGMPGAMPRQPGAPGADCDPLELDSKTVKQNAFGAEEGGDYRPLSHQVNFEYLILWFKGHHHPPLITTGDANDAIPGALGQPGTTILHNDRDGAGSSSAFRVTYSWWVVDPEVCCLDSSFMIMEQRRLPFNVASNANGEPVLSRPFFNPTANTEDADPRALPFVSRASLQDNFYTRLMGAEANFKYNVTGAPCTAGPSLTMLAGPRWIRLDEKYTNNDVSQDLPPGTGETRTFQDNVTCYNEFFGGQIGGILRARWDRLILETSAKIAVGQNFQTLKMSGFTRTHNDATGVVTFNNEGLWVQSTNSGISHPERVSVVPEFNLNIGLFLTDNLKFSVGYGVFDMSNVIRPGTQLDRRIDIQAPGIPTTLPARNIHTTDFWAQWVNFGFEFIF
jgi:Putative beta barrel porin-7 (BBP7)